MYRELIDAYIEGKQEEMLQDLIALMKIDSQRGTPSEGKPYGEGPAMVLDEAGRLMEKYGLQVTDYDHYVVTGDYGSGSKALDILAHLDVVPVTDSWTVTAPFEPKIVGDRIYGRGSADDKGPAVAALYAVRAIEELNIPLKHSVRLIFGSDEECGSSDLEHYYGIEKEAPYTFTPDADFPLINMEKARLAQHFERTFAAPAEAGLIYLQAGDKVNVVPAKAAALLRGVDAEEVLAAAQKLQEEIGITFESGDASLLTAQADVIVQDGDVVVRAQGTAAHGSTPEEGNNALTGLLTLITRLTLPRTEAYEAVEALLRLFPHGDTTGSSVGIAMSDEVSGALTFNLGVLTINARGLKGEFDIRSPLCGTDENVTAVLAAAFEKNGMHMEEGVMSPVHYVPAESPLVQTLLGSYEKYFGKPGKPLYTGGGTYVHHLERGVAFGCMVPEVDNHMHGDDEFMEIPMLVKSAKIFADAIITLCNMD